MKNILFFLLLSFSAQAQIDLSKIIMLDDSTTTTLDTAYWEFHTAEYNPDIVLFQADYSVWRNGQKSINLSSGPVKKELYLTYLNEQERRLDREINTLIQAIVGLTEQQSAIMKEIVKYKVEEVEEQR